MDYKYLSVDGINLAYTEKNASAKKTIFFIHGNSMSAGMWDKQFKSDLFSKYRLIAFDLPSHGHSSVPKNQEVVYKDMLPYLAGIISKAVKTLCPHDPYFLAGLSLGVNIIAEMLNFKMNPAGIAMISPDIFGESYPLSVIFRADADVSMFFTDEVAEMKLESFFHPTSPVKAGPEFDSLIQDFNKVQPSFRSALLKYGDTKLNDEIVLLQGYPKPLLFIFGEDDKFLNTGYLDAAPLNVMDNTIHKIQNSGHYVNMEQPEIVNKLLAGYFDAVADIK